MAHFERFFHEVPPGWRITERFEIFREMCSISEAVFISLGYIIFFQTLQRIFLLHSQKNQLICPDFPERAFIASGANHN